MRTFLATSAALAPVLATSVVLVIGAHAASSSASSSSGTSATSDTTTSAGTNRNCRTVYRKAPKSEGSISSSVTAGPHGVSGETTGANSVTVHSGSGGSSSSVSTASANGRTIVTSSNGDCTIYVDPDKK
jgi:hypothetical protein